MGVGLIATAASEQHESLQTLRLNEYVATATFVTLLWDALITLGDEITYIWPKPRTAYIKWMYLFMKYFTLVFQAATYCFQITFVRHHSMTKHWCDIWRGVESAEVQLLMLVLDIVLFLRIYALYGRKAFATLIGIFAVVLECVTAVISYALLYPDMQYDSTCMIISFTKVVILMVVGTIVSQGLLLWLAYRKKETIVRADRRWTSMASVTIRDGAVAFVCIVSLFLVLLGCQLADNISMNLAFYWFPVFISATTNRIIMNLQRLGVSGPEPTRLEEFTTQIWRPEFEMESLSLASS